MIYLLDTNIVSHQMVDRPNDAAMRFLNETPQEASFLSVMTLMEIRAGIEKLEPTSGKRIKLERWLTHRVPQKFHGRILPVTPEVADVAGRLLMAEKKAKRTPGISDLLIAATAKVYGMEIATLNRKHFEYLGVPLVDLRSA